MTTTSGVWSSWVNGQKPIASRGLVARWAPSRDKEALISEDHIPDARFYRRSPNGARSPLKTKCCVMSGATRCSELVLQTASPVPRSSFGMCNRHYDDPVLSSVIDDTIRIAAKRATLATGIGPRIVAGVCSDQVNGRIDLGRKSDRCTKTLMGVPIKSIIEFCTCGNIEFNRCFHDRSWPEPPCG